MASQRGRNGDMDALSSVALEGSLNAPLAGSPSQRPLRCTAGALRLSPSTNLRGLALRAYDVCLKREEPRMRKVTAVLTLTLVSVVLSAGAAMADSTYPPTVVKGVSG